MDGESAIDEKLSQPLVGEVFSKGNQDLSAYPREHPDLHR
jgi:hypothetical protein